jgi:Rrf2 family protein
MAIGQLFSQRFGYAVHALCYMAAKPESTLSTLPELAEWMRGVWPGASETYLSNVLQRLARGGILRSHRGISGGYSLGRAASDITLRDLTELLEGVSLNRCGLSLEGQCPVQGRCAIPRALTRLEEQYLKSLAEVTIADLARQSTVFTSHNVVA